MQEEDSRGVASSLCSPEVVRRQQQASGSSSSGPASDGKAAPRSRRRSRRHRHLPSGERPPIKLPIDDKMDAPSAIAASHDSTPPNNDDNQDGGIPSTSSSPIGCLICLSSPTSVDDRAILPLCQHSLFCFPCILQWTEQKRTCPLCNADVGPYILHRVRSEVDYERHYLRPVSGGHKAGVESVEQTREMDRMIARQSVATERLRRQRRLLRQAREARRSPFSGTPSSSSILHEQSRALSIRKYIYRHSLYALHIGSNRHTGFRPCPTAGELASSPHLVAQLLPFLRREIQALPLGPGADIPFLATYVGEVFKSLEVRSEGSVRLLADLFGVEGAERLAEHFCHEVATWLRSGARSCAEFDRRVRYDMRGMAAQRRGFSTAQASSWRLQRGEEGANARVAESAGKWVRRPSAVEERVGREYVAPSNVEDDSATRSCEAARSSNDDAASRRSRLLARLAKEREELAARAG